jgi:hypothetical protein
MTAISVAIQAGLERMAEYLPESGIPAGMATDAAAKAAFTATTTAGVDEALATFLQALDDRYEPKSQH